MEHKREVVMVSITTLDGEVLDRFEVRDWRDARGDADTEAIGSPASESLLAERISRYVGLHPEVRGR